MSNILKAATIAGSDASGGAGLEADLKTFEEFGVYGMAAVTTVAVMDPRNNWAHSTFPISEEALRAQLETIFAGVGVHSVKSAMFGADYAIALTAEYIKRYDVKRYVLDPVMVCKGADKALNPELNENIARLLLPLAYIAVPNLFEAGQLAQIPTPRSIEEMKLAAKIICSRGARSVLVKGGSKLEDQRSAVDVFYDGKSYYLIDGRLFRTKWTHGAGCTLAAAITAGLARGLQALEAVELAKKFITASLAAGFPLNKWVGPGNPSAWRGDALFS